ncbi:MAG: hypothetical protein GDA37_09905 [Ekhidna sp.]|nr:hypothetical protein [Ekhidna sp.]
MVITYIQGVIISFGVAHVCWKKEKQNLGIMSISSGVWSMGYALGCFNEGLTWKLDMLKIELLGMISASVLWFFLTAIYSKQDMRITKKSSL